MALYANLRAPKLRYVSDYARPPRAGQGRKLSLNTDYFKRIGPAQAYWLGFLAADGCVAVLRGLNRPHPQFVLSAYSKDKDHLEKLKKAINAGHKIVGPYRKSGGSACHLHMTSYDLCLSLERFGIIPRKSFVLRPPKLRPHLYRHWCRGIIDGDGCFNRYSRPSRAKKLNGKGRPPVHGRTVLTICLVGSYHVCRWFKKRFGGSCLRKAGVYQWSLTGERASTVIRWMYADPKWPHLARKRKLAYALGLVD